MTAKRDEVPDGKWFNSSICVCWQGGHAEGQCQIPRQRHDDLPTSKDASLRPRDVAVHARENLRPQHTSSSKSLTCEQLKHTFLL